MERMAREIHEAAKALDSRNIKRLINGNEHLVAYRNEDDDLPIHVALRGQLLETEALVKSMRLLLQKLPYSMYMRGSDGEEPMELVCKRNFHEVLEVMMEYCPYNKYNNTECHDGEFVEMHTTPYYEDGDDVPDKEKLCLQLAVEAGNVERVQILMKVTNYKTLWYQKDVFITHGNDGNGGNGGDGEDDDEVME